MKVNKYLPFALVYFFVNSLGLPFGLTYMAILSPFFYYWILVTRKKDVLIPFFAVLFPFIFIHINFIGVDIPTYLVSLANLTAVYIFCQAFYTFLISCKEPIKIFRKILVINFILCLIAIPLY